MVFQSSAASGNIGEKSLNNFIEQHFEEVEIPSYTLVFEKNQPITQVGCIQNGFIELILDANNGQLNRKGVMGRGDFFGLEILFGNGHALFDGLVPDILDCYIIDSDRLKGLLYEHPDFRTCLEARLFENFKRFLYKPMVEPDLHTGHDQEASRFKRALAYIDVHYMDSISLDSIARMSGLSRFYFSRMFKRETGRSFKSYLTLKRLQAAKKLLRLPDINISQACYSVGFNDVSYFARIFKKYENASPSEYRKTVTKHFFPPQPSSAGQDPASVVSLGAFADGVR